MSSSVGTADIYTASGRRERAGLISQYLPMVRRQALALQVRLPASVEVDDLIQAGIVGLIDAYDRFDATQGASFSTYASQRVYGAMIDELRSRDWLPRSVRRSYRRVEQAMRSLEQILGRPASEREVADHLEMPITEYRRLMGDANDGLFSSYQEESDDDTLASAIDPDLSPFETPEQAASEETTKHRLMEMIGQLPEREQMLLALYYQEELNLKEIGAVMGISESRVSQLHSQAVARLRVKLSW